MEPGELPERFAGGLTGGALGDAIGELAFAERSREGLERRVEESLILRYTDDTAMAIGLAESLIHSRGLDNRHLGDTFRRNYNHEPWRGYASGPLTIFSRVAREGLSYEQAAAGLFGGSGSYGNGAAMRIAPVGLFFHDDPELYERCRTSCRVTHTHPVGIDGAAVLAKAVALALTLPSSAPLPSATFLEELVRFSRTSEIRAKLETLRGLLAADTCPEKAASALGRGVAVQASMPYALYAFLRSPDRFEGCLFTAVLHGGDCDTLGAMACSVCGARLGLSALPRPWRQKLEDHRHIEGLGRRLLEARR